MMSCFRVKLTLLTPFYLSNGMTLDGLLSGAIYNKMGLLGEESIPHIPLEMQDGIFKASSIAYDRNYQYATVGRIMNLRGANDLSDELFSPNKRKGAYGHIDRKRGPYKTNLSAYPGVFSQHVYFWGVGDMEKVEFLLKYYILGIGKRSNAGAGEIANVELIEMEEDFSWVTNKGKPARPLPVAVWKSLNVDENSWPVIPHTVTVPYWGCNAVDSVVPEILTV